MAGHASAATGPRRAALRAVASRPRASTCRSTSRRALGRAAQPLVDCRLTTVRRPPPCRRRRPCRSCGRCPRRRGRATASARSRAGPRVASSRRKTSVAPDLVEVDAALLRDAVHEHLERVGTTESGSSTRLRVSTLYTMPAAVRRTLFATLVTSLAALAVGRCGARRERRLPARDPHSPNAHRITDAFIFVAIFTGIIFVARRGRADRLHRQVPARQARARPRRGRRSTARRGSRSSGRSSRC